MEDPRFVYQRSQNFPGYVAVMAQFLPTFEGRQPQDESHKKINYIDDEEIDEGEIDNSLASKTNYCFVVDRSGSMRYGDKMEITKESLKLFV